MISMTGYGKALLVKDEYEIEIELKSINAKFLDIKTYIPRDILFLEPQFRSILSKRIKRGTLECRMRFIDHTEPIIEINEIKLKYFNDIMHKVMHICKSDKVPLEFMLKEYELIEYQSSISENPQFVKDALSTLKQAIKSQQKMAAKEGISIKRHIHNSLRKIQLAAIEIENDIPRFKQELYDNMRNRILEVLPQSDNISLEQRLMQELAIYLDRYDVHEEIKRLLEHIDTAEKTIAKRAANDIGKTLSFVFQEMQREANTLGSKYSNPYSFTQVLCIKEEIERCREIIQNVM